MIRLWSYCYQAVMGLFLDCDQAVIRLWSGCDKILWSETMRYCDLQLWSGCDQLLISYCDQAVISDCDQPASGCGQRLWSEAVIRGWLGFDQAVIRDCDKDSIQLHETFPHTPPAVCSKHLHTLHSCEEHIHALNASMKSSHAHFILLGGLDPFPHLVTMWIFCN